MTQAKQVALAQRELNTVGALVDKGLAVTSRQFALERTTADLQSGMLDVQTALVRAQQEVRKAERDATDLVKDGKAKASSELREAKASIEQLINRMNTSETLVAETATSPRTAQKEGGGKSLSYWIQRRKDGGMATFPADDGTLVELATLFASRSIARQVLQRQSRARVSLQRHSTREITPPSFRNRVSSRAEHATNRASACGIVGLARARDMQKRMQPGKSGRTSLQLYERYSRYNGCHVSDLQKKQRQQQLDGQHLPGVAGQAEQQCVSGNECRDADCKSAESKMTPQAKPAAMNNMPASILSYLCGGWSGQSIRTAFRSLSSCVLSDRYKRQDA